MFRRFSDAAEDILCLTPQIHFNGDSELIVENCRRIEEYNDVFIRLVSGRLFIQIWGCGLRAFDYNSQGLVIRGRISQVEFIERSANDNERPAKGLRKDMC